MPEKSGIDAALCAPLPVGPTVGVTACPKAAVTEAATAANVANKRKSRRRTPMAISLYGFAGISWVMLQPLQVRRKGARDVCIWPTAAQIDVRVNVGCGRQADSL